MKQSFHAHFTSSTPLTTVPPGYKITTIALQTADGSTVQHDYMITRYYAGSYEDRAAVIDRALDDARYLQYEYGIVVDRCKVEYVGEVVPSVELTSTNYLEAHIKLLMNAATFIQERETLVVLGSTSGFRLSNNPKESTNTHVTQFANLRIREGNSFDASNKVKELCTILLDNGFNIEAAQVEISVFDSTPSRDRWWA